MEINKEKKKIIYRSIGMVERGGPYRGYHWANGHVRDFENGTVSAEWLTRSEARKEAGREGCLAVFLPMNTSNAGKGIQ